MQLINSYYAYSFTLIDADIINKHAYKENKNVFVIQHVLTLIAHFVHNYIEDRES